MWPINRVKITLGQNKAGNNVSLEHFIASQASGCDRNKHVQFNTLFRAFSPIQTVLFIIEIGPGENTLHLVDIVMLCFWNEFVIFLILILT